MKDQRMPSREITPKEFYLRRREFLASAGAAFAAAAAGGLGEALAAGEALVIAKKSVTTTDPLTPYKAVTTYNNFYEFGSDKGDPVKNAGRFKPKPWSVAVEGLCAKPGVFALEDILKPHPLEERVYRHRCVEGWSMIIPWVGFPLGECLKRFEPAAAAKFVELTTIKRPEEMNGQRGWSLLPWPYVEGLRMDEAMHPLALLAVGLYGEELPNQNGAPLRLVVPWKYGFKSVKSIVKIKFVEKQPTTTWMRQAPDYYGFYSNVNPSATDSGFRGGDQSTERRIGDFMMRKTLPFNGYGEQVAALYTGMNLRRQY